LVKRSATIGSAKIHVALNMEGWSGTPSNDLLRWSSFMRSLMPFRSGIEH
jgi:hypothetical protein